MKKAVFLDRDGTLIRDNGFLGDISQVSFYPFAAEALRILQEEFDLFIVTNQCGVANGIVTLPEVNRVNEFIVGNFAADGINIRDCYVCPHAIDGGCKCRKPSPFFAEQAALEYDLDLSGSYVIGDHLSDINFAHAFGGHGYYVLTGHGRHHRRSVPDNVSVSRNVLFAARKIITGQ